MAASRTLPPVTAIAALSGPLPKLGVVAVALLAAWALLARSERTRATAMLGALVLAPVLLLADIWHSPQLHIVHRHPLYAAIAAAIALVALAAAAVVLHRRPPLVAMLAIAALPFRVPIQTDATTTNNLLVPLYLVVAAASLALIVPALRADEAAEDQPRSGWIARLLALYIVLYAVQATYSSDFEKALQNMVFFYVPFTLLFVLIGRVPWDRQLFVRCTQILVGLALVFACIGFAEYATKTIILNPKLVVQNDLHTYFVVNSVFFDPDIFGRFLALVIVVLASLLVYDRPRREQLLACGALLVLWCCLLLTLSRTSLLALLAGIGALIAVRFARWRTVAAGGAAIVVLGIVAVAISPTTFGVNQGLNGVSSGRGSLLSGGLRLFADRPLQGFGSGSFETAYHAHNPHSGPLTASHPLPVTIAAEQGLIGELAYVALVVTAIVVLLRGARGDPVRAAIGAAFLALLFHTMLYADFLEDPLTWALLGVGAELARRAPVPAAEPRRSRATGPLPAPA
jgi:putative inorganic carbon (HCO3(-)) transporter